jgi:uncharacterized membrane protein YgaE (UPF0421/DUF939 family)
VVRQIADGRDRVVRRLRESIANGLLRLPEAQLSVRAAVAAGLAVGLAGMLRFPFPIYAMLAAVIVTELDAQRTRALSLHRLAGTVVGATLGAAICTLVPPDGWGVGFGVLAAILTTYLLRLRDAAKVAGYVCAIVLLDHGVSPWSYALYRLLETALGIVAAVAVSMVPKLIPANRKNQPDA